MSTHPTAKAYQDPGTPEEISRRKFLAQATIVAGNVIGLSVAIPVIATLVPTKDVLTGKASWWPLNKAEFAQLQTSTDKPIKVFFKRRVVDGYIDELRDDYVWGLKLKPGEEEKLKAERPELFSPGEGKPPGFEPVVMNFVMFSPICPHLGCHFDWNDAASMFICPCHGSVYTRYGKHTNIGPAPRGLDPLPFRERSGRAEIEWVDFKAGTPARLIISYT